MTEILLGLLVVLGLLLLLTLVLLGARERLLPGGGATVTVNGGTPVEARQGDTLLLTLQNAGFGIPAGCGGKGSCGLCRVTAQGPGAGEPGATEKGMLSARERRDHVRLACQVSVKGPLEVELPAGLLGAETRACRVVSNRMLAPLIRELVLELPGEEDLQFRAGSFMQLSVPGYRLPFSQIEIPEAFRETWEDAGWRGLVASSPGPATRAYSIANRPQDRGRAVFNIRLAVPPPGREESVPPGLVSSYLFGLKPGDPMELSGPYGDFHAQPTGREMVFVGGGVGMAPLRALIHEQVAAGAPRKMTYFYGARSAIDLFYTAEFDAIAAAHPGFSWVPALSDPAPGDRWTGPTGFIHNTLAGFLREHPAPEDCEYYLCGPPLMIAAVRRTLDQAGVEPERIFSDDFGG
ncbi:NADH:ubiquinone reductase (Na(+)-transporting) subunit F [Poseidonocella sp. HB161398]|uniref:NADH:ubiquinone reductase (Na(+)-transporting) subunit F n=1 Tax=Poseidonocella sp. HB161398 TaxID=2320855 RepID=UPI0011091E06|nr:NADH:ubiquinone reductase (Na(+)-transporting) subunit F [Poseidonocella sp. HB161398]